MLIAINVHWNYVACSDTYAYLNLRVFVMRHGILHTIIAAFILSVILSSLASAEESGLDSAEIKKIRYLSSALLKSRVIEKERIERELLPQRQQLKEMQDAIHVIDVEMLKSMSQSAIEPNSTSFVGDVVVDGEVVSSGEGNVSRSVNQQSKAVSKFAVKRQRVIDEAIKKLDVAHNSIAESIPKKWELWKSKGLIEHRAEKMVTVNRQVKQDLLSIANGDSAELKKIRTLEGKLTLKKKPVPVNDLYPTLETRTKHRP